jgi:choline-glycine betaine transporter
MAGLSANATYALAALAFASANSYRVAQLCKLTVNLATFLEQKTDPLLLKFIEFCELFENAFCLSHKIRAYGLLDADVKLPGSHRNAPSG